MLFVVNQVIQLDLYHNNTDVFPIKKMYLYEYRYLLCLKKRLLTIS